MTIHAHYDNECPACGKPYIKYNSDVVCPNCGEASEAEAFDFIQLARESILYNGNQMPMAFGVFSFGDHVLYTIFRLFSTFDPSEMDDFDEFLEDILEEQEEWWRCHLIDIATALYPEVYGPKAESQ